MISADMNTDVLSQISASTVVVMVIQWLKNTKWIPFINAESTTINRIVSFFMAVVTAFGLHFAYNASAGTLLISGLHWDTVLHGAWDVVKSYSAQHLIFKGAVSNSGTLAELVGLLRNMAAKELGYQPPPPPPAPAGEVTPEGGFAPIPPKV